jgi:hypothetical protein
VVLVEVDLVGEERTAGGLTADEVEDPVAYAGTVGEPEGGGGLGRLAVFEGVVEQASVFRDPRGKGVLGAGHVACDGRFGCGLDGEQVGHGREPRLWTVVQSQDWTVHRVRRGEDGRATDADR